MVKKIEFKDYLLPIVGEKENLGITYYIFKLNYPKEKWSLHRGYINPSLEKLPRIGLSDFLEFGFLYIAPEFTSIQVSPYIMVYLKPFAIAEFIGNIFDAPSEDQLKEKIDIKNLCLPETVVGLNSLRNFAYSRRDRAIYNYGLLVTDNFVLWMFKEMEKEFLLFIEAYREEKRRQENA